MISSDLTADVAGRTLDEVSNRCYHKFLPSDSIMSKRYVMMQQDQTTATTKWMKYAPFSYLLSLYGIKLWEVLRNDEIIMVNFAGWLQWHKNVETWRPLRAAPNI